VPRPESYVGLMSGTSLDGVDAALVHWDGAAASTLATHFLEYPPTLRAECLALSTPGHNELERAAATGITLSSLYARAVRAVLDKAGMGSASVRAIGCHGQTIRHRPALGFSIQLVDGSRLAEATGIDVICDFRSRDLSAGGQGAPLTPAFHADSFGSATEHRAVVNVGGIANITNLPPGGTVTGFDCGPGNVLMDAWAQHHLGTPFDEDGRWARKGRVDTTLLGRLLCEPFLAATPPKSTGRELFCLDWLVRQIDSAAKPGDVQATLLAFTTEAIAVALETWCSGVQAVFLCGGGARNGALVDALQLRMGSIPVNTTAALGVDPDWVEAIAFAWLARRWINRRPGNLPAVTGAAGPRILGGCFPA